MEERLRMGEHEVNIPGDTDVTRVRLLGIRGVKL